MKKALVVLISLILIAVALSLSVSAGGGEVYTVVGQGGEYSLSVYEEGSPAHVASGEIEELLCLVPTGSEIVFSSVYTDKHLVLPKGDFVFKGSISFLDGASLTVPEGASVTLDGFSAVFSEDEYGQIRVKGGSLTLQSSSVFGGRGSAVLIDYSSSSSVTLRSGLISTLSEEAAVKIENGSFTASGGRVVNAAGSAVSSDASLFLLGTAVLDGAVYDVESTRPISLTKGAESYNGGAECSVRFLGSFSEGEMRIVFYGATASALERITLVDSDGKEETITYFDTTHHTEERNFGAVYKPYTVKFYDGTEIKRYNYLSGEAVRAPEARERTGYSFSGWYLDEEGGERYSFGSPVNGSLSLFARYSLLPPSFEISSLDTVYDRESHTHTFSSLSHPLLESGGFFGFEWYKDGVPVSRSGELAYKTVADSGTYECKVTFSYGTDSVSTVASGIVLRVHKAVVDPPEIPELVYTGREQYPTIYPSVLYTAETVSATDAGSYPIAFKLNDNENYKWRESDNDTVTRQLVVLPADNLWSEPLSVRDVYLGDIPTPSATPLFGQAYYLYSESENGEYTQKMPTLVGKYYVKAAVLATNNYKELVSVAVPFFVMMDEVCALTVSTPPTQSEYCAFDKFVGAGLTLSVSYKSGREECVGVDKISIGYQSADSFRFGDNAVILTYGGVSIAYPVNVSRANYDLSGITLEGLTLVYDGKYHTARLLYSDVIGKDGIPLILTLSGGGSEVGSYPVTLSFSTESRNYNTPSQREASVVITPLSVELFWNNLQFTYDGEVKLPVASYTDANGVLKYAKVSGGGTDAGRYTACAVEENSNHTFINPTAEFEILRADYDLSGIRWSGVNFLYDGTRHTVTLDGLPNGVFVTGYTDGYAINAGKYTAKATLAYDTQNYNPPPEISHEWCILEAEYDTDGFYFTDAEAVFDGLAHYPTLVGEMPVGIDGIRLGYSFSAAAVHVSDSEIPIRVIFHTESGNYRPPADLTLYVTISPMDITVEWIGDSFVYNGKTQAPAAKSEYTAITVTGGGENAGEYTALAETESSDYHITNPEHEFRIEKAENVWINPPTVADIYESGALYPTAVPLSGEVIFRYFLDSECTEECEKPETAGEYYMRAEVKEGENYLALISEPIPFTITAVVPVGLFAELTRDSFKAFESLNDADLSAYLEKNDGSREALGLSALTVEYQNGSSLRRGDTSVAISAEGFTLTLTLSVGYADYDLSGVAWEGTEAVYDGTVKAPVLSGLPSGISVLEYVGEDATLAGSYTFYVRLDYDRENYNEPIIPPTTLTIKKQEIEIPEIAPDTYDGELKVPFLQSELYKTADFTGVTNAGSYTVTLTVCDPENYAFSGGEAEAFVTYTVLPRVITVRVPSLSVYLWESVGESEYVITDGTFLEADSPSLYREIRDGKVVYISLDSNYLIVTEGGDIVTKKYPSPGVSAAIIVGIILVIILIFLILNFLKRRKDTNPPEEISEPDSPEPEEAMPDPEGDGTETGAEDTDTEEIDFRGEEYSAEADGNEISAGLSMNPEHADELITDSLAKNLLRRRGEEIRTFGSGREIINVDTLSENFLAGERVDVNILKGKSLVPYDTAYIKVLARGVLNKPLTVYANDFSLSAVKMIALTGGEAIKVSTVKEKTKSVEEKRKST